MTVAGRIVKVADIAEVQPGFAFSSGNYTSDSNDVRLLRGVNVNPLRIEWNDVARWPQSGLTTHNEYGLRVGDIVIGMDRPWISSGFRIARVTESDVPSLLVQRVARIRARQGTCNDYLYYLFGTDQFTRHLHKRHTETTVPHISHRDIESYQFVLPPLPEQRRIADILDKADAIRRKRKEAITLTENLLRSAFLEMFGDPVTNPKGWPVKALGAVTQLYAGNSLPAGTSFEGQLGGVLLLKVGDMNLPGNEVTIGSAREWTDDAGSSIVAPAGAVVIPKRGGAIATNKKRVLLRPAALDPNLMAIAPKRDLALEYLRQWFELLDLASLSSGSAVPQLNKKDLDPLPLPIPPMKLQTQFRTFAAHLEKIRQRMDAGCGVADHLFSSLVHRAFRGELTAPSTSKRKQLDMFEGLGGE